jgi:hypothetical protein
MPLYPLPSLDARQGVALDVQDRDIDVAIGEKVTGDALVLQPLHHLQAEVLDVKILSRFFVLRLDRDVPDSCHGRRPPGSATLLSYLEAAMSD